MAANIKMHLLYWNKNNKIIVKLNNIALAEKMKKQTPKKVTYRIDTYFIEKNITTVKLCIAQILLSRDITILIISKKQTEKLRREDS